MLKTYFNIENDELGSNDSQESSSIGELMEMLKGMTP